MARLGRSGAETCILTSRAHSVAEMISGRLDQPERSAIIRELLAEAIEARAKRK